MEIEDVTINTGTNEIHITVSPAVIGVEGKNAFQVWLQDNPGGTNEDWIKALTPKISFEMINDELIITTE